MGFYGKKTTFKNPGVTPISIFTLEITDVEVDTTQPVHRWSHQDRFTTTETTADRKNHTSRTTGTAFGCLPRQIQRNNDTCQRIMRGDHRHCVPS